MRSDATFIGIEVDDSVTGDAELAKKLDEACPVDIYDGSTGRVEIVDRNIDECILCELCIQAYPPVAVKEHQLFSGETLS
jgi:NAD-dependent dihydropyrimidine dehydrogenase PreA subunit